MYCVVPCCLLRCLTALVFHIPSLKASMDWQCIMLLGVHNMGNETNGVKSALTSHGVVDRGVKVGFSVWSKNFSLRDV